MTRPFQSQVLEFHGRKFQVDLYVDDDAEPPWEEEDGHIVNVRHLERGERPNGGTAKELARWRTGDLMVYDFAASVALAKKDGWGCKDSEGMTKGQIAVAAVLEDAKYMASYIREDWFYIGVDVRILGPDGEPVGDQYDHAVWRVDYGHPAEGRDSPYWKVLAGEIADEILYERRAMWRRAMKEARERRFWELREVVTA